MLHSFYLPPDHWGQRCALLDQEARHLSQALRIKSGERVRLFDGAGRYGIFSVVSTGKREVILELEEEYSAPRPQSLAVMALAWNKSARRGFFMEKAVELGVHEVWLWQADHSQGRVPSDVKESWQGQFIAGMKQSQNPWLPTVHTLQGISELIERSSHIPQKLLPWEHQENVPMLTPQLCGQAGCTIYVIGPEGGFSVRELEMLKKADFKAVSLGKRVLRCETAAVLCLGIHWWASHLLPEDRIPQGG